MVIKDISDGNLYLEAGTIIKIDDKNNIQFLEYDNIRNIDAIKMFLSNQINHPEVMIKVEERYVNYLRAILDRKTRFYFYYDKKNFIGIDKYDNGSSVLCTHKIIRSYGLVHYATTIAGSTFYIIHV